MWHTQLQKKKDERKFQDTRNEQTKWKKRFSLIPGFQSMVFSKNRTKIKSSWFMAQFSETKRKKKTNSSNQSTHKSLAYLEIYNNWFQFDAQFHITSMARHYWLCFPSFRNIFEYFRWTSLHFESVKDSPKNRIEFLILFFCADQNCCLNQPSAHIHTMKPNYTRA